MRRKRRREVGGSVGLGPRGHKPLAEEKACEDVRERGGKVRWTNAMAPAWHVEEDSAEANRMWLFLV